MKNDLIFKRMNVKVTRIFIRIVLHKDSFCHRGKSQLFVHELAQGAFDLSLEILFSAIRSKQIKPRQNRFAKKLVEVVKMTDNRDRNETVNS